MGERKVKVKIEVFEIVHVFSQQEFIIKVQMI